MRRALLLALWAAHRPWALRPYRVVFRDVHEAFRAEDAAGAARGLGEKVIRFFSINTVIELDSEDEEIGGQAGVPPAQPGPSINWYK